LKISANDPYRAGSGDDGAPVDALRPALDWLRAHPDSLIKPD